MEGPEKKPNMNAKKKLLPLEIKPTAKSIENKSYSGI